MTMEFLVVVFMAAQGVVLGNTCEPECSVFEQLTPEQQAARVVEIEPGFYAVWGYVQTCGYEDKLYDNWYIVFLKKEQGQGYKQFGEYVWTPKIRITAGNVQGEIKKIAKTGYKWVD